MAIDWNEFEEDLQRSIDNAADRTDEELASKISSLTRMTNEEIIALFPEPADTKKLASLMSIVHSSQTKNEKINKITANVEDFGGVMLTLLTKFV